MKATLEKHRHHAPARLPPTPTPTLYPRTQSTTLTLRPALRAKPHAQAPPPRAAPSAIHPNANVLSTHTTSLTLTPALTVKPRARSAATTRRP
eukprot:359325-Chlamydomonas_euryale.AAC.4